LQNRIAHLFDDAPGQSTLLSELLWTSARKALALSDLYSTDSLTYDVVLGVGEELAELARTIEVYGHTGDLAAASHWANATRKAIESAEAVLAPLAPQG
tara:strand:- start:93 stop:389 length:297 start_codon:yes stop_codon:yes gene_type:complete